MARVIISSEADGGLEAIVLDDDEIILNSEECRILYFELSHHTCYRDHYAEFSAILKKIAKCSQEKTIEAAKSNLDTTKS